MDVCRSLRELIYEYSTASLNTQIWKEFNEKFLFDDYNGLLVHCSFRWFPVFAWSAVIPNEDNELKYTSRMNWALTRNRKKIYRLVDCGLSRTIFSLPARYYTSLL